MDYTPLKGRWATLLFIAVIALGATVLSLRVESNLGDVGAMAPALNARPDEDSQVSSGPIVVVNADGSPRQTQIAASSVEDDQPELESGNDPATSAVVEEQSMIDEDWDTKNWPAQSYVGTRIE